MYGCDPREFSTFSAFIKFLLLFNALFSYYSVRMPEVKRLKEMNDQMKRELGVEREKVSVSAARYTVIRAYIDYCTSVYCYCVVCTM